MGTPNHPSKALPVPGGRGASKSRNPYGPNAPDAKARRSIGEALRGIMSGEELGRALLAIAAGQDPWAKERKKNPDNVPVAVGSPEGIDWHVRFQALKLFAEYHSGKPVQGVVVQAEIDQRIALEGRVETGPMDFRAMPASVRDAFRVAALAALGKAPPAALRAAIDANAVELPERVQSAPQGTPGGDLGQPAESRPASLSLDEILAEDLDGLPLERAPGGALALGVEEGVDVDVDVDVGHGSAPVRVQNASNPPAKRGEANASGLAFEPRNAVVGGPPVVDLTVVQQGTDLLAGEVLGGDELHDVSKVAALEEQVKSKENEIRLTFPDSTNLVDAVLARGVLTVRFRDGRAGGDVARTYRYANVTPAMMAAWREAPSAGAWFAREIRVQHRKFPVITAPMVRPVPVAL